MPWWGMAGIFVGIFFAFVVLHFFEKNKRPFRRAFISMVIGAGILTAVNLSSGITGVYIPVSMLSVLVSVIGGVPGVTLLLTLNMFF